MRTYAGIYRTLQFTVMLVVWQPYLYADVFLTSENLNSSLKQMQRSQLQIQQQSEHEDALYLLGKTADDLANLLTDEVKAHGAENEKLIELALDRTEQIQIDISWVGENQGFYYDGRALYEYRELYPDGKYISDVTYRIIKREFYLAAAQGEDELLESIKTKRKFIETNPDFDMLHEIEFYLAIDYRDLWRHYRDNQSLQLAKTAADNARQQFQLIIDKYKGNDESEIASRLLERFIAESATQPAP